MIGWLGAQGIWGYLKEHTSSSQCPPPSSTLKPDLSTTMVFNIKFTMQEYSQLSSSYTRSLACAFFLGLSKLWAIIITMSSSILDSKAWFFYEHDVYYQIYYAGIFSIVLKLHPVLGSCVFLGLSKIQINQIRSTGNFGLSERAHIIITMSSSILDSKAWSFYKHDVYYQIYYAGIFSIVSKLLYFLKYCSPLINVLLWVVSPFLKKIST